MRNSYLFALLFVPFACFAQESPPLSTEWVGSFTLLEDTEFVRLVAENDSLILHLPERGPEAVFPISDRTGHEYFAVSFDGKDWTFNGQLQAGDAWGGTLSQTKGLRGFLRVWEVTELAEGAGSGIAGSYQLPDGNFLLVSARNNRLRLHSPFSEQYSTLYPIGSRQYYSSSGELLTFSDLEQEVYQTAAWQVGAQSIVAQRSTAPAVKREQIVLESDTIGLSVFLPPGKGPHPALIIPMGAANYDRSIYRLEAQIFAQYGIATLIYDNYGNDESSGDLQTKTFRDKQVQAIELFHWLAEYPGINPRQIGFRGGSQGGRIAAMAAAELPETAFLILLATPMETRMDQQLYALAHYHRQQGYGEDVIARSSEIWRRYFVSADALTIDTVLVESSRRLLSEYPDLAIPRPPLNQPPQYPWHSDIMDATRDYLPRIDCPVLCLFGSLDDRVPPQKSIAILRSTLQEHGKNPPEVILYPGAGHSFMYPGYRIAKGLFMDQVRFLYRIINN